jgi:hypothetical protein
MLEELYRTGQQLLYMIGMCLLLWGTFSVIAAVWGQRSPLDYVKGIALLIFGVYLVGLVKTI